MNTIPRQVTRLSLSRVWHPTELSEYQRLPTRWNHLEWKPLFGHFYRDGQVENVARDLAQEMDPEWRLSGRWVHHRRRLWFRTHLDNPTESVGGVLGASPAVWSTFTAGGLSPRCFYQQGAYQHNRSRGWPQSTTRGGITRPVTPSLNLRQRRRLDRQRRWRSLCAQGTRLVGGGLLKGKWVRLEALSGVVDLTDGVRTPRRRWRSLQSVRRRGRRPFFRGVPRPRGDTLAGVWRRSLQRAQTYLSPPRRGCRNFWWSHRRYAYLHHRRKGWLRPRGWQRTTSRSSKVEDRSSRRWSPSRWYRRYYSRGTTPVKVHYQRSWFAGLTELELKLKVQKARLSHRVTTRWRQAGRLRRCNRLTGWASLPLSSGGLTSTTEVSLVEEPTRLKEQNYDRVLQQFRRPTRVGYPTRVGRFAPVKVTPVRLPWWIQQTQRLRFCRLRQSYRQANLRRWRRPTQRRQVYQTLTRWHNTTKKLWASGLALGHIEQELRWGCRRVLWRYTRKYLRPPRPTPRFFVASKRRWVPFRLKKTRRRRWRSPRRWRRYRNPPQNWKDFVAGWLHWRQDGRLHGKRERRRRIRRLWLDKPKYRWKKRLLSKRRGRYHKVFTLYGRLDSRTAPRYGRGRYHLNIPSRYTRRYYRRGRPRRVRRPRGRYRIRRAGARWFYPRGRRTPSSNFFLFARSFTQRVRRGPRGPRRRQLRLRRRVRGSVTQHEFLVRVRRRQTLSEERGLPRGAVAKLWGCFIQAGRKHRVEQLVRRLGRAGVTVWAAYSAGYTVLATRQYKQGGKAVQVPAVTPRGKAFARARRWLKRGIQRRGERTWAARITGELLDLGFTTKQKDAHAEAARLNYALL